MASKTKKTAKKTTVGKTPVKKTAAKKKAAATVKKAPAKKPAARSKPPAKKTAATGRSVKRAAVEPAGTNNIGVAKTASASLHAKVKHLSAKELKDYHQLLLNLRDRVVDEISFLAGDNLSSVQLERTGEEGTDNFNREFALKLVSSEQDIIYEIDEALTRMRQGTYGICEISGEPIEKERLKVMPHARHSVKVQSELEKGRARYRPFGPTIPRG